jgi:ABC-type antimicrobial peptide transport system permease subunit
MTVDNVMTMERRVAASVATPRFYMLMLGAFAVLALLLAAVGIYGILAYGVSQRRREIAIRLALGARADNILAMVLGQGMRLTAAGLVLGVTGAFLLTRLISGMLFGTTTTDPTAYAAGIVVMTAVALAACWVPARRASRIRPLDALRD